MPWSCDGESARLFSAYSEAIALKVREGAPLDTYSIDRRAMYNYAKACGDDEVYMPICFCCARRFPHLRSLGKKTFRPAHLFFTAAFCDLAKDLVMFCISENL